MGEIRPPETTPKTCLGFDGKVDGFPVVGAIGSPVPLAAFSPVLVASPVPAVSTDSELGVGSGVSSWGEAC